MTDNKERVQLCARARLHDREDFYVRWAASVIK
jgi:hypothetical protein